jgi:hypothetical protein
VAYYYQEQDDLYEVDDRLDMLDWEVDGYEVI